MTKRLLALSLLTSLALLPAAAQEAKPLKPVNLPFNTAADEDDPHVDAAGTTLFFTGENAKSKKKDIMFVRRAGMAWGKKANVILDYVTTRADDRSVYATGGTYPHYLYFATKLDAKTDNFDLYVAVRQDTGKAWSAPTPVMKANTEVDELYPWLSADGKSLYFSRKGAKGYRQMVSTREGKAGPGGWGEPEPVGLPDNFHHATLTPDGSTMFVQGPLEKGRTGLFVVRKDGKEWGKPEPLETVNDAEAPTGDRSPGLSRDGQRLYFASDRSGGKGGLDIYVVPTATLIKKK